MNISTTILKYIENSFIYKLFNKLDITEDSPLLTNMNSSFLLSIINNFFKTTQNIFAKITEKSGFIKHIDYFILTIIALLVLSITFCSTKIIGLLAVGSFVLLIIKLCIKKGETFSLNSLDCAIFSYMTITALSVAFSALLFPAISGYIKMLIYFGAYLSFSHILKNNPKRAVFLLALIAVSASIESLLAILQQFNGVEALASWQDRTNVNPEALMNRVYGTLKPSNPNLLAGYLIPGFACSAGMFFLFLKNQKIKPTLFFLLSTMAITLAIVFTGSRGAYLALAGMFLGLFMMSGHVIWQDFKHSLTLKKTWIYVGIVLFILVAIAIITSPALQHRIGSIFAFRDDSSNSFRMNVYISSFQMFLDNWLIGIGPGNNVFRLTYGLYMKTGFDALGAYSVPLEIAIESGIFALISFAWLIIMVFLKSFKTIISNLSVNKKILTATCLLGIAGMMIHGMVDTIFYRPQINLIFWMLIAVFASIDSSKSIK